MATMTATQQSYHAFSWLPLDKYRGAVVEVRLDVCHLEKVAQPPIVGLAVTACFCTP